MGLGRVLLRRILASNISGEKNVVGEFVDVWGKWYMQLREVIGGGSEAFSVCCLTPEPVLHLD